MKFFFSIFTLCLVLKWHFFCDFSDLICVFLFTFLVNWLKVTSDFIRYCMFTKLKIGNFWEVILWHPPRSLNWFFCNSDHFPHFFEIFDQFFAHCTYFHHIFGQFFHNFQRIDYQLLWFLTNFLLFLPIFIKFYSIFDDIIINFFHFGWFSSIFFPIFDDFQRFIFFPY